MLILKNLTNSYIIKSIIKIIKCQYKKDNSL